MIYFYFTYQPNEEISDYYMKISKDLGNTVSIKNIYCDRRGQIKNKCKCINLLKENDTLYINDLCDISRDLNYIIATIEPLIVYNVTLKCLNPKITIDIQMLELIKYLYDRRIINLDYKIPNKNSNEKLILTEKRVNITQTWCKVYDMWRSGIIKTHEAAKLLNISKVTFLRYVKVFESSNYILTRDSVLDQQGRAKTLETYKQVVLNPWIDKMDKN